MYTGTLSLVSNRAHWIIDLDATSADGTVFDWTPVTNIQLTISDLGNPTTQVLSGSLADGHIVKSVTAGRITWTFTPDEMSVLVPGTYAIGLAYENNSIVETLVAGVLPVVEGVARI